MRDSGKTESWLLQKIKENPFQFLWPLGLAFGGAILIGFFFQMSFMPDMNFSEASGIFIAATLIGLVIIFPIFLPMVPAVLIQTSEFARNRYKNNRLFIWNTLLSFETPMAIAYWSIDYFYIWIGFCIICFLISCERARKIFTREVKNLLRKNKSDRKKVKSLFLFRKTIFIFVDAFIWSLFPFMLSILFFRYGGFAQNIGMDTLIPFAVWVAFTCMFTYILIICLDADDLQLQLFIFILYIILSLALTGSVKRLPSAIIRSLSLGEMQNVSVLLKDEGCEIFNALPIPVGQNPLYYKRCHNNIVRSVHLISRIASPYVFEVTGRDNLAWRITIPKEQVISLMIPDQRGGGKRSGEPAQGSR